jgi:hypothetical protein
MTETTTARQRDLDGTYPGLGAKLREGSAKVDADVANAENPNSPEIEAFNHDPPVHGPDRIHSGPDYFASRGKEVTFVPHPAPDFRVPAA